MTRFRIPYGCRCFPMCCLVTGVVLVLVTMISDTPRRSSSVLRVPGFSLRLDVYGRMEEFMRSRSTVAPSTSTRASPLRDDLKVASKVLDTNWQPTAEISKHGQGENRTGESSTCKSRPRKVLVGRLVTSDVDAATCKNKIYGTKGISHLIT